MVMWSENTVFENVGGMVGPWGIRPLPQNLNPRRNSRDSSFDAKAVLTSANLVLPSKITTRNYFSQDPNKSGVPWNGTATTQGDPFFERRIAASDSWNDAGYQISSPVSFGPSNVSFQPLGPYISELVPIAAYSSSSSGSFEGFLRIKLHNASRFSSEPSVFFVFPGPQGAFVGPSPSPTLYTGDGIFGISIEYGKNVLLWAHTTTGVWSPVIFGDPLGGPLLSFPAQTSNDEIALYIQTASYNPTGLGASDPSGFVYVQNATSLSSATSSDHVSMSSGASPFRSSAGDSYLQRVMFGPTQAPASVAPTLLAEGYASLAFQFQQPVFDTNGFSFQTKTVNLPKEAATSFDLQLFPAYYNPNSAAHGPNFVIVDQNGNRYNPVSYNSLNGYSRFTLPASTSSFTTLVQVPCDGTNATNLQRISFTSEPVVGAFNSSPIVVDSSAVTALSWKETTPDNGGAQATLTIVDRFNQYEFLSNVAEIPVRITVTHPNISGFLETTNLFVGRAVHILAHQRFHDQIPDKVGSAQYYQVYEIDCVDETWLVKQGMTSSRLVLAGYQDAGNVNALSAWTVKDAVYRLMEAAGIDPSRLYWDTTLAPGSDSMEIIPQAADKGMVIDPQSMIAETITSLLTDYLGFYFYYDPQTQLFRFEPPTNYGGNYPTGGQLLASFTPYALPNTTGFTQEGYLTQEEGASVITAPIRKNSWTSRVMAPICNLLSVFAADATNQTAEAVYLNSASFDFSGASGATPQTYSFLGRIKPLAVYAPGGANDNTAQFIAGRTAQWAFPGRKVHEFDAPFIFVTDTSDPLNQGQFSRPLRYYDAVYLNGIKCFVKSVTASLDRDFLQTAHYELEEIVTASIILKG